MGRAIPQSLHDRAELLARSHPLQVVAELIGKHPSQVTAMKRRGWKAADWSSKCRAMPRDFPRMRLIMTSTELCAHYVAGTWTVARWMKECPRRSRRGENLRTDDNGRRVYEVRT